MGLEGKVIAITRPEEQANELAKLIIENHGKPYIVPTIEILPLKNDNEILQFLKQVSNNKERIDFLIFLSKNGVKFLLYYLNKLDLKEKFINSIKNSEIISIGINTKKELELNGFYVSLTPENYNSKGIVKLLENISIENKSIVILSSNIYDNYITKNITDFSVKVRNFPIYEISQAKEIFRVQTFINALIKGKIDVSTFTSSATVINLFKISKKYISNEKLRRVLNKTIIVSIGTVTKKALNKLGVKVDVVPRVFTIEAMLKSLSDYLSRLTN